MKGCFRLDSNSTNGIFGRIDFIKEKPTATTGEWRSHAIWQYRVKNLMCPHCGNKTHRRDDHLRRKPIPLHVPSYVDRGICIHPECQPASRVSIMYAQHDDDDDDIHHESSSNVDTTKDSESMMSLDYDSTITIVEEYWKDMNKSVLKLQSSSLKDQGKQTYELEDIINQMTRAIMQVSLQHSHNLTQRFSGQKHVSGIDSKPGATFQQQQSAIEDLQKQVLELKTNEVAAAAVHLEQLQNIKPLDQAARDNFSSMSSVSKFGKFMNLMEKSMISLSSAMASVHQDSHDLKQQLKVLEQSVILQVQKHVFELKAEVTAVATRGVNHVQADFSQQNDSATTEVRNSGNFMDRLENSLAAISCSIASLQQDSHDLKQRLLVQQQTATVQQQTIMEQLEKLDQKMQFLIEPDKATTATTITTITTSETVGSSTDTAEITNPDCPLDAFGTLEGHTGSIRCCCVFANDQRAISGSDDTTLRVWDMATRQTLLTLCGHSGAVWCCGIFGNGKYAISGSSDHTLHVWDLGTGQTVRTLNGHTNTVMCCSIFANDQKVLTGSWDTTLRVWELGSGRRLRCLKGHTSAVTCCTVYGNGKCALSGSKDKTLKVWDLSTGKVARSLAGHEAAVMCFSIFDNDQFALSGSADKTLRVWNLSSGESLHTLKGHSKKINCCTVFALGVSGSGDKKLPVWDLTTGQGSVGCSTVFASNKRLLTGGSDNVLHVWDLKRKKDPIIETQYSFTTISQLC